MPSLSVAQSAWSWLTSLGRGTLALFTNMYFWNGLIVLLLLFLGAYLLVDRVIMPDYTRHEVTVQVPSVTDRPFDEAVEVLSRYDLDVEREAQEFNPNVAREVVVDQRPRGQALVKPGRRVYLTVNAGDVQQVTMPSLDGLSRREARNRVRALGLSITEEQPDSIPSAYRNTITGHEPAAGDSLAEGSGVTLYYSTGLGEQYVEIPDITGMTVADARAELLTHRLRAFVIGARATEEQRDAPIDSLEVVAQSREPGTRMREGSEVRLSIEPPADG